MTEFSGECIGGPRDGDYLTGHTPTLMVPEMVRLPAISDFSLMPSISSTITTHIYKFENGYWMWVAE